MSLTIKTDRQTNSAKIYAPNNRFWRHEKMSISHFTFQLTLNNLGQFQIPETSFAFLPVPIELLGKFIGQAMSHCPSSSIGAGLPTYHREVVYLKHEQNSVTILAVKAQYIRTGWDFGCPSAKQIKFY